MVYSSSIAHDTTAQQVTNAAFEELHVISDTGNISCIVQRMVDGWLFNCTSCYSGGSDLSPTGCVGSDADTEYPSKPWYVDLFTVEESAFVTRMDQETGKWWMTETAYRCVTFFYGAKR